MQKNLSSTPNDLQATLMGCAGCFALLGVVVLAAFVPFAQLRKGTGAGGTAH